MTAPSDIRRPYRTFFSSPAIGTYRDPAEITVKTFVDTGLSQDDIKEWVHSETLRRLDRMTLLIRGATIIFCVWLGLAVYGAAGLIAGFAHPFVAIPSLAAAVAIASLVIRTKVQATHAGNRLNDLQAALIASGRIAGTDDIARATSVDLQRIDKALTTLQENRCSSFDAEAMKAAIAVLRRDDHEPSRRQRDIAESSATDENTTKIRAVVTASDAKWRSDIALAERLILELEEAADQKDPVVT